MVSVTINRDRFRFAIRGCISFAPPKRTFQILHDDLLVIARALLMRYA